MHRDDTIGMEEEERMKKRFQNLSMSAKMTVTLVIPMVLLCLVIFSVSYPVIQNHYSVQVNRIVQQSVAQADAFVNEYIQGMEFRMDRLCANENIKELVEDPEFGRQQEIVPEYWEFTRLSQEFVEIQGIDSRYQLGMYVPDTLRYAQNRLYFFPESEYQDLPEYEDIEAWLDTGGAVFTVGTQWNPASHDEPTEALVLLRKSFDSYGKPLCVFRVSIAKDMLEQILVNANVTQSGYMILLDRENQVLFSVGGGQAEDAEKLAQAWEDAGEPQGLKEIELLQSHYYADVTDREVRLLSLIPIEEIDSQTRLVRRLFLLMVSALIFATLLIATLVVRGYVRRLSRLNDKMNELEQGYISTQFSLERDSGTKDEIEQIYYNFNYMTERIRELLKEHYRMGKNVQLAELKALQAQINPHFLYNTLDLMNWMALDYDAEELADILKDLARFYRLSLNHGRNFLSIGEEIEHVETYVRIENVHFDGAITLEVDVPEEIRTFVCPNIILQPFVENSIVHGIAEHPEITSCHISIRAVMEEGDILFRVRDDGPGIPLAQIPELLAKDYGPESRGYGVRNINFRLKLYYGEAYGISYDGTGPKGTVVTVRIPGNSSALAV